MRHAFSLVELLVVVAVLAILAAIGLPNLLEAQARSKVSRVEADVRTIRTALEAYRTDHAAYPSAFLQEQRVAEPLAVVTSPVAYITTVPRDPFGEAPYSFNEAIRFHGYAYVDRASTTDGLPADTYGHIWPYVPGREYFVHSCGPNRVWDVLPYVTYDPSNGTTSVGDICVFGP